MAPVASSGDILLDCYHQIASRQVVSVQDLHKWLDRFEEVPQRTAIVRRGFRLIRQLHWGIFRDVDPVDFPALWRTFVIPDRSIKDVGDLKQSIATANVYCGLLDIHAYTDFCQRNRHNSTMLRMLDDIITRDIRDIARKYRCVSHRSAGDNIVLVGSNVEHAVRAALAIIDYFSRRRVIKHSSLTEQRRGKAIILPDMHVTAGIAGGRAYGSLIITRDGDISGSLINTAARLQSLANTLSPARSKVMVTSHVYAAITRKRRIAATTEVAPFDFFQCGTMRFKGVKTGVVEVLFTNQDFRKIEYQGAYRRLLETIERRLWRDRLIPDAMHLIVAVLKTVPDARIAVEVDGRQRHHSTRALTQLSTRMLSAYRSEAQHTVFIRRLRRLLELLEQLDEFDKLVLMYLSKVVDLFDRVTSEYEALQDARILEHRDALFTIQERAALADAERLERIRSKLLERAKRDTNRSSPKNLWNTVLDKYEKDWVFEIYSGKR